MVSNEHLKKLLRKINDNNKSSGKKFPSGPGRGGSGRGGGRAGGNGGRNFNPNNNGNQNSGNRQAQLEAEVKGLNKKVSKIEQQLSFYEPMLILAMR